MEHIKGPKFHAFQEYYAQGCETIEFNDKVEGGEDQCKAY